MTKISKISLNMFVIMLFVNLSSSHGVEINEYELLLSFKSSINDPFRFLSNWKNNTNFCLWNGVTCNNATFHIIAIDLSSKNISTKLFNTSQIFRLPFIENINLSNNQIFGEIPRDVFFTSTLRYLNLSNNNLTGRIPTIESNMNSLQTLDLSNNMLSGQIPRDFGLVFPKLKVLDLGGNVLSGKIPISMTNMNDLEFFTLASNQLFGQIPRELGRMKTLKWIYFGYNNFSGEIPTELGDLSLLNHLDLVYNNLSGQIPLSFGNLYDLRYLFLYKNKLSGSIPTSVFVLKKLVSLDLSDNNLSGEIPEVINQLQSLEILHLFSNNFTGKIPNGLSSLPRLQVLQLWSNEFSGEIPGNLGRYNNLTVLDLSSNNLTGKIPESLCFSRRLFKLILFSNSLHGEIPKSLSFCKSLQRVRLENNRLSGRLSVEFTELPLVYFFDVSKNYMYGEIGDRNWSMSSLQMLNLGGNRFSGNLPDSFGSDDKLENLDLSGNRFSGEIPSSFGLFSELMELNIGDNELTGQIPKELYTCKKLVRLDLSNNKLIGKIPSGFARMPVLGEIDLSVNRLSGEIPSELGESASLIQVNISHNMLRGSLPMTGVFLAINSSAVVGNSDLCDGYRNSIGSTGLPPCENVEKYPVWWFVTFIASFLVVSVVGFFGYVFLRGRRTNLKLKRVENEDGIWELRVFQSKIFESIGINDVLSSLSEEKLISKSKNEVLYKGKSSSDEMQFVVWESNYANNTSESSFCDEMEESGKIRHPNIVGIYGILCRSKTGAAYVVYEHVEGIRLNELLCDLTWGRRKKIAVGIAKAVRFLHCRCSPSVIAGNISPEKIIIDGKDEPHLRLALPGLACLETKYFISSAYVTPEVKEGKDITEKNDIYGLGLFLIELLTGKSPTKVEFGVHESIVEWARYCYSDCHLDVWIDPMIKRYMSQNNNQNEIVETMNLALHCTATDPSARPCADEVYESLRCSISMRSCFSKLNFSSSIV